MLKELLYPFDTSYILSKKKKLRRKLLDSNINFVDKKIAILGGSTTNDIKLILELFLLNYGIRPSFYESEYNKFYEEAMFSNPMLLEFKPDIIYIHTTNRNIIEYPSVEDDADRISFLISREIGKFEGIWNKLREIYKCPIIQNNFEMPFYRLLGNKDASDIHGKINFLTRLNMKFYEYAQTHEDFYICDINYISADYGLREWSDTSYYHMYKYALNVNAIPYLSFNVANIIKSIFGKNKKGFVLDLDNTLWGGVIAEDGIEQIAIGPENALGEAYLEFQKYIKEHQKLGIILNINSKNDYSNVILGLNHPYSELKKHDFICIKANWESKDKNFFEIANELNLLPESLVFVDDNPAERYIVTKHLPEVCAPELISVQNYIQIIDRNGFFETTLVSQDDKERNKMYLENTRRMSTKASYSNYQEFLVSLKMNAIIREFEPMYYSRIAQLTNKSNQFNLTTKRYTQAEIEEIANCNEYLSLYGKLMDRFGDNGLVSVIIGHQKENVCHIDLWIMSCRVLKRDLEYAMMDVLVKKCIQRDIKYIYGYFFPTSKNSMVAEFYKQQGFSKVAEDDNGNTKWLFEISDNYNVKNLIIEVED